MLTDLINAGLELQSARQMLAYQARVAKTTLNAQKLEGEAAVKLIESAAAVRTDPNLGQNVDIVV